MQKNQRKGETLRALHDKNWIRIALLIQLRAVHYLKTQMLIKPYRLGILLIYRKLIYLMLFKPLPTDQVKIEYGFQLDIFSFEYSLDLKHL